VTESCDIGQVLFQPLSEEVVASRLATTMEKLVKDMFRDIKVVRHGVSLYAPPICINVWFRLVCFGSVFF